MNSAQSDLALEPTGVRCTPAQVAYCSRSSIADVAVYGSRELPQERLNRVALSYGLEDRRPRQGFALFTDTREIAYYAEARPDHPDPPANKPGPQGPHNPRPVS